MKYGGLSKDGEFGNTDAVTEITVRPAAKHIVEFSVTEVGFPLLFFGVDRFLRIQRMQHRNGESFIGFPVLHILCHKMCRKKFRSKLINTPYVKYSKFGRVYSLLGKKGRLE